MTLVADVRCEVCDESARYVKPPIELSFEAFVCEGRQNTPPEVFDVLPEWIRLIMRGINVQTDPNQAPKFINKVFLCGVCAPLLGSAEGQAKIADALRPRVRVMPPLRPEDMLPPVKDTREPVRLSLPPSDGPATPPAPTMEST